MNVICKECGAYINSFDKECPNCGAPNEMQKKSHNNPNVIKVNNVSEVKENEDVMEDVTLTTIAELKKWYISKKFPPEDISRFFIGLNYASPDAFGIYQDFKTKNYVVYKMDEVGVRNVLYDDYDEAVAVDIVYNQIKRNVDEIKSRAKKAVEKRAQTTNQYNSISTNNIKEKYYRNENNLKDSKGIPLIIMIIIAIVFVILVFKIADYGTQNGDNFNILDFKTHFFNKDYDRNDDWFFEEKKSGFQVYEGGYTDSDF